MALRRNLRAATVIVAALTPLLIATGCSSTDSATDQAQRLSVTDQWVKASDTDMTAAFATLVNDSDSDIRVVSASSDVAGKTELHEVVDADGSPVMREKKDGYSIPAHSTLELKPGAEHIMLMDLHKPIAAGETVAIDLRLADGSTLKVDALARDFAGNQEDYQP